MRYRSSLCTVALVVVTTSIAAQQPSQPASSPQPRSAEVPDDQATIRQALTTIDSRLTELTNVAREVKAQTTPQGFPSKVVEGFAINTLWEFFGFSPSDKSVFGMAFTILGLIGTGVKLSLAARRRRSPWLDAALTVYLVLCVLTLTAFSYSNHTTATQAVRMSDPALRDELQAVRGELADFRTTLNRPGIIPSKDGSINTDVTRLETSLNAVSVKLSGAINEARDAAANAENAARSRGTGWGWHLLILVLLTGVIALQLRPLLADT